MKVMLDSGAYSAHTRKDPIKVEAYADYLQTYAHRFVAYVSLDVIPAHKGETAAEQAAQASFENYRLLTARGLQPIHKGERPYWLERYVDSGATYIGLGGVARIKEDRKAWIGGCFEYLVKHCCKVHGFGITSSELVLAHPWYSVDSVSWILKASYGEFFVAKTNGELSTFRLNTTHLGGAVQPYISLGDTTKRFIERQVAAFGHTVAQLKEDKAARAHHNALILSKMGRLCGVRVYIGVGSSKGLAKLDGLSHCLISYYNERTFKV